MKYENILTGEFIKRPNRFIADISIDGKSWECHVKNTGRCRELLIKGSKIYVQKHSNPKRKTQYSLISVLKGNVLVNIDSQAPNKVVEEFLRSERGRTFFGNIKVIKPEFTYGNSRFDFYVETEKKQIFIEVKGVTLEVEKTAVFPDAPTKRGVKHVLELCKAINLGYETYIIFVIQMKGVTSFRPNDETHYEFGEVLRIAQKAGVNIKAFDCIVEKDSIGIDMEIPVCL